jgi:hypothetical protein
MNVFVAKVPEHIFDYAFELEPGEII